VIRGAPKFDGLAVAKISIDYLKTPIEIDVQAAFMNTETGDTHGWTRGTVAWSDETRGLLNALRVAMERDLAARHLSGADGGAPVAAATYTGTSRQPSGLSEPLGALGDTDNGTPSA
jgi:hypothetical protein